MDSNIRSRFEAKVRKHPGEDGCWEWIGARNENDYGKFFVNPEIGTLLAHRWSYMMEKKTVLDEETVLDHLCRNHWCVRPSHLDPVSQTINTARGTSETAENKRKRVCKKGHPFTESNTYRTSSGARQCRTCMREATRRYERRHPQRALARMRRWREVH